MPIYYIILFFAPPLPGSCTVGEWDIYDDGDDDIRMVWFGVILYPLLSTPNNVIRPVWQTVMWRYTRWEIESERKCPERRCTPSICRLSLSICLPFFLSPLPLIPLLLSRAHANKKRIEMKLREQDSICQRNQYSGGIFNKVSVSEQSDMLNCVTACIKRYAIFGRSSTYRKKKANQCRQSVWGKMKSHDAIHTILD